MIIFGAVMIVLGLLLGAGLFFGLGVLSLLIGVGLIVLGRSGRPLAGRTYWY